MVRDNQQKAQEQDGGAAEPPVEGDATVEEDGRDAPVYADRQDIHRLADLGHTVMLEVDRLGTFVRADKGWVMRGFKLAFGFFLFWLVVAAISAVLLGSVAAGLLDRLSSAL